MTIQRHETIFYRGKEYPIEGEPFNSYLEKMVKPPKFDCLSTACHRGYYGTWKIANEKLYLIELQALHKKKDIGIEYFFPDKKNVFAEWFNGEIKILLGESKIESNYWLVFEDEILLKFKSGVLVNINYFNKKKQTKVEPITNNPFRILGVEVNHKASALQANLNKIKAYAIAETLDELMFEFDFPAFGTIERSEESISKAKSLIDLPHDKIKYALFWFYKGGSIDLPAFDCLMDGDIIEAAENWRKASSTSITNRNFSAFQNLSTLYLFQSLNNGSINNSLFADAIRLKLMFLESDYLTIFCNSVADSTYKKSREDIQLLFIESLNQNFVQSGKIGLAELIEVLNNNDFSSKTSALKLFVHQPISNIENQIEQSKTQRKINPATAVDVGMKLNANTARDLATLRSILGKQDLKYGNIADKLADELLQCGIDFYKNFRDSVTIDPGIASMQCLKLANNIAIGEIVKQRCVENIEGLQEWIDDKPERDKQKKIKSDFERLKGLIDEYGKKNNTIANARQLITTARSSLSSVKSTLGSADGLYLSLSTRIASDAQNMLVAEVNNTQSLVGIAQLPTIKFAYLMTLKEKVDEAWDVTTMIGNMDLVADFRSKYITNRSSLSSLKNQLSQIGKSLGQSGSSSNGYCYIATMVYGSYSHPQVLVLRKFRDDVLSNNNLGRQFIRFYYKYSPTWVEIMKNNKTLNKAIKAFLNCLIKFIK